MVHMRAPKPAENTPFNWAWDPRTGTLRMRGLWAEWGSSQRGTLAWTVLLLSRNEPDDVEYVHPKETVDFLENYERTCREIDVSNVVFDDRIFIGPV